MRRSAALSPARGRFISRKRVEVLMTDGSASSRLSRRALLASATALVISGVTVAHARSSAGGLPWEPGSATPPVPVRIGPYVFFTADEAATIEAAVDRLIPPDDRIAGGKDAGCAT